MKSSHINYNILVVNDGSDDQSGQILELAKKKYSCAIVNHKTNRGYGAAIKTGIDCSKSEFIAITDADGTYPIDQIPSLFKEICNCDMVVGSRPFKCLPNRTKPAKWFINKLANYIVDQEIPDINSGLRVFKREVFMQFVEIIPNGFSLTTTITLAMVSTGYNVKFRPIDYYKRKGKSKIRPVRDTLRFINLILKIGLYFAPLKIFLPISFMFFTTAIVWGGVSWLYLGKFADSSFLVIILFSFQVAVTALISELINRRLPNRVKK